jgi:glycosyltransferase involved in cell wall biosynthesis
MPGATETSRYRIDFALVLLTGNLTRYLLTRPIVESDPAISARWYPIRTWIRDDPLRFLPGAWRVRGRQFLDTWRLYFRAPADAIVIHAFETYYLYTFLQRLLRRKTIIINNPDGLIAGPEVSSRRLSRWLQDFAVQRTDLFVPWSHWSADQIRKAYPGVSDDRLLILHPGIDLSRWPLRAPAPPSPRFRLLFVAGNLLLKGADTLLDAFDQSLRDTCTLSIATQSGYLPSDVKRRIQNTPHVDLYLDLPPGSAELQRLYRESDAFVSPTNSDTSSWVALEALATGIPVIICPQGGIPDIVHDGETGLLIPPKDPAALVQAVERLRTSPELRAKLITQGRAHVENHFDGDNNTKILLATIKSLIDTHSRGS